MIRALGHNIVFHENVVGCGRQEVDSLLGDMYYVFRMELDVGKMGWAATRKRQLLILFRKAWLNPWLVDAGVQDFSNE